MSSYSASAWINACGRFSQLALSSAIAALFLCSSAAAYAVASQGLDAGELVRVSAGEAVVRVDSADSPADGLVIGAVDIDAPATRVWDVLFSCEHAAAIMPNLTSCRVLEASPDGLSDVREHGVRWISLLPEIRSEFRSEYVTGKSIRFQRSGGDMRALDGEWRIEQRGKSLTRLHYVARVGFGALIPAFVIRNALANDVPGFLNAIKAEAVRSAEPRAVER